jgi:uncharacterized protein YprB with RNaseH-like and TPR domain
MTSLADKLRGIVAAIPASRRPTPDAQPHAGADGVDRASRDGVADVLGGDWVEAGSHRMLVVDRVYRPGHRHGHMTLADHVLPEHDRWCSPFLTGRGASALTRPAARPRALFVDLETTGLAGGAGTYAFLVGCGWYEDCVFRVRQLFMSSAAMEAALLDMLSTFAASADLIVSFNGKSFDLPLIETRYFFHRRATPFEDLPHLDMLHAARRLWRPEDDDGAGGNSCRLTAIETTVCGHVREDDVPGAEAPMRYFHFVRTGDPRPLAGVFEHNRLDLLSLAFLTARAAQLADEGAPALKTAREAVGLGQLLERSGDLARARRCFARAAGTDGPPLPGDETTQAEAMHAYAAICRRERRYAEAAGAWRSLLELRRCPPRLVRSAAEALAVHHEHRLRDPHAARAFALRSAPLQGTASRQQALQHRLARLDRKLVAQPLSLF